MLPPPAITTRRTGSSRLRISLITRRMSLVAARKNTSSPDSMTVSPSGREAAPGAVDRDRRAYRCRADACGCCAAAVPPAARPAPRAHLRAGRGRPRNRRSAARPGSGSAARMYVVTSCSGLTYMSTAKPPPGAVVPSCGDMKRSVRLVKSGERMRAMRVGVRNRVHATWHATMFTSSLLVSATSMSAPAAPACSSVRGLAPLPRTVRMSSRSCRSRSTSSSTSTTVTSLASSRARW